jgi:hypothetical protein
MLKKNFELGLLLVDLISCGTRFVICDACVCAWCVVFFKFDFE